MQSLSLVWSALWRVQVSHLAVLVVVPAVAAALRAAVGIVLLPFLLVGLGDRTHGQAREFGHLSSPGCWLALAPCELADRPVFALPESLSLAPASSPYAVEPDPFLPLPTALTARHLWFAVWLIWFVRFLVRRSRTRRAR